MRLRCWPFFVCCCAAVAADNRVLVDRVGTTGFVQLEGESFQKLSPREQALTYWLTQASIAIDPINYDQNSAFGLRQKRLLEAIVRTPGVSPEGLTLTVSVAGVWLTGELTDSQFPDASAVAEKLSAVDPLESATV